MIEAYIVTSRSDSELLPFSDRTFRSAAQAGEYRDWLLTLSAYDKHDLIIRPVRIVFTDTVESPVDLAHPPTLRGVIDAKILKERIAQLEAENAKLREEQRWIPVGERLPEEDQSVLARHKDGSSICFRYYEPYKNFQSITHWMPLPEAP